MTRMSRIRVAATPSGGDRSDDCDDRRTEQGRTPGLSVDFAGPAGGRGIGRPIPVLAFATVVAAGANRLPSSTVRPLGGVAISDDAKGTKPEDLTPDRPRLTPQGHGSGSVSGEDSTDPNGGAKQGQGDKAEG